MNRQFPNSTLAILENARLIDQWSDRKIPAGQEWDGKIRRELQEADIVLVLLSPAFFASKYIQGVEMKVARARQQQGKTEILPVLLEDSPAFAEQKWLGDLQAVPSARGSLKPINKHNPQIDGWNAVEKALREMIAAVAARRKGER